MSRNLISLSLTEAEKTRVREAIQTLVNIFASKLIALSREERASVPRVGEGAIPFLEKVAQYVVSNPEFIPMFGDAVEFEKDLSAFGLTGEFLRQLLVLVSNLEDTKMLAGAEADDFARRYYGAVGQAAKMGVPNAQAIYDDLSTRYEAQKRRRRNPAPGDNQPPS